jgi:hypothetical protein
MLSIMTANGKSSSWSGAPAPVTTEGLGTSDGSADALAAGLPPGEGNAAAGFVLGASIGVGADAAAAN